MRRCSMLNLIQDQIVVTSEDSKAKLKQMRMVYGNALSADAKIRKNLQLFVEHADMLDLIFGMLERPKR